MKRILFVMALLLASGAALAQNTVANIHTASGGTTSLTLGEEGGIYFDGNNVKVKSLSGTEQSFAMDQVARVTFSEDETSVNAVEAVRMKVYPNPTTGKVVVEGIGAAKSDVMIYSLAGTCVMKTKCSDGAVVDLSALPQGIYLLKCGEMVSKVYKH